jgi:hypothetical protein
MGRAFLKGDEPEGDDEEDDELDRLRSVNNSKRSTFHTGAVA